MFDLMSIIVPIIFIIVIGIIVFSLGQRRYLLIKNVEKYSALRDS